MPIGVVELRDVRDGNRTIKKRFISGTAYEITPAILCQSGWGAVSFSEVDKDLDIEYDLAGPNPSNVRRYAAVPAAVRRLLEVHGCDHTGLALDKFVYRSADQSFVKHALQKVADINNARGSDTEWFRDLRNRWTAATNRGGNPALRCTTTGPLTLHLARASALENAGICLHPLYGFAYLPGSGLKGMARAYAETVAQVPKERIEAVFGNEAGEPKQERQRAGAIIFHDAWPESCPPLSVDIVNNHHPDYYQAAPDDNDHPPGDWENPVPVYFLAVKPGTTFTFFLSRCRSDVASEQLDLARDWLLGALCHLGAGAKTAAGYGAFKPENEVSPSLPPQKRVTFEATLELTTPAFLAGANQHAEDCDLRPATLRGLLRWWWRTMHAGFVDVKTLRALEAAIWGDTQSSGAVRIIIEKVNESQPQPYDKRNKAKSDDSHKKSQYGIPSEENAQKITPGLWYASYGMDETNRRRHYREPGARWKLRLISRTTRFFANRKDASDPTKASLGKPITAEQASLQAKDSLWLLCHFGAIGSKTRKGFGSLAAELLKDHDLDACRDAARQLRNQLGLRNGFDQHCADSPSLELLLDSAEVNFFWPNVWSILDQVGFAYQAFAKKYKHRLEKKALGLPRRIGPPVQGNFNSRPPVTGNSRHSSPVQIHVEHRDSGWAVRVIAFPAAHLPDLTTSRTFLEEFLKDFGDDLRRRADLPPPSGSAQGSSPTVAAPRPAQTTPNNKVKVKFLGPHDTLKTPQQAYWVQEDGKKRGLVKYGQIPTALPALDSVIEVYRTNDNPNSPEYRWDAPPPRNPPRNGPGGQRQPRRR